MINGLLNEYFANWKLYHELNINNKRVKTQRELNI